MFTEVWAFWAVQPGKLTKEFTFNRALRLHLPIKYLGVKMPRKRKSSLGRVTAAAKKNKEIRLNEDEKTYSQRLQIDKERHFII